MAWYKSRGEHSMRIVPRDDDFRRRRAVRSLLFASTLAVFAVSFVPLEAAGQGELPLETVDRLKVELHDKRFSGVLDVGVGDRSLFRFVSGSDISTSSVFWIGSVSKQFAAVAALRLVDQGKLSLEGPLAEKLGLGGDALRLDGVPCTLADALHHTCGLPSGNVCSITRLDELGPQEEFLRCVADLTLKSRPGVKYAYSNVGYDLVGVLVSRTAGIPYRDFLKKEFFAPLAMGSTGVDLRSHPDARQRLIQGEAFNGFGWSRTWPWLLLDPSGPGTAGASGNIFSTVEDLHTWNRALHGGHVLLPATYSRLVTPLLDDYGLGVSIEKSKNGTQWIWHNGSITPMGWSSFVAYIPSKEISVVGLANRSRHSSHVMRATRSLVLAALGEAVESPILKDAADQDLAVEMLFFILPFIVGWSILWLGWNLARGPRRGSVQWYGALLTNAALYLFAVSLFDFYGRAATMSPPLLVVVSIGVTFHRKRLGWSFRQTWADKKGRRKMLGQLLAAGLLGYVSAPTARLWLGAFVVSQGLLLYFLVARRQSDTPAWA